MIPRLGGAIAVVLRGDQVLLVQRGKDPPGRGLWGGYPGGARWNGGAKPSPRPPFASCARKPA